MCYRFWKGLILGNLCAQGIPSELQQAESIPVTKASRLFWVLLETARNVSVFELPFLSPFSPVLL